MLTGIRVRVWGVVGAILCGVLIASCYSVYYDPETGERVEEEWVSGSWQTYRTKMTREEYDKWLSEEGAFLFEVAADSSDPSPSDELTAELHLVFADEQGQQTGEFYHLTGTARIEGGQVISDTMTTAGTAQGDPVTASFAITPTHVVDDLARRANGTLSVTLADGTYTGDIELGRFPDL